MSENKHTPVETFDCQGCRPYCYGGYHMEADKDGLGDYVKTEDYRALEKQRDELLAALERAIAETPKRYTDERTTHGDRVAKHPTWVSAARAVIASAKGGAQ